MPVPCVNRSFTAFTLALPDSADALTATMPNCWGASPMRLSCQLAGLARADNPSAPSRREAIAAASENRYIPQRSIIW